jgi:hypothetical protein
MTHQPVAEEILQHLISVHACSEAISLRQEIIQTVTSRRAASSLIPAQGSVQVDVTADVAEGVAERLTEFDRLHDAHHAQQIAERMLEFLKDDVLGLPHEHDLERREDG